MEVSGFIDTVLKVSSSARDTDFAVKIVDVAPDGTAWIIGDTILRARYRDGFDKPVMMAPDKVYTLKPTPIATSITFGVGHRSEEHTSELQSLMRISYAVFCLKKKKNNRQPSTSQQQV